jgi:hypothetical protein
MLLSRTAAMMSGGQLPAMARMMIGESRKFPDLRPPHSISQYRSKITGVTESTEKMRLRTSPKMPRQRHPDDSKRL